MKKFRKISSALLASGILTTSLPVYSAAAAVGDLNGDGAIGKADVELFAQYFAGWTMDEDAKEGILAAGDVNGDEEVTRADAMELARSVERWECTVTFDANADGVVGIPENQVVAYRECAVEPTEPTREGYVFCGWYSTNLFESKNKFNFNDSAIDKNITLYAKWNYIGEIYQQEIKESDIITDEESNITYAKNQLIIITDDAVDKDYVEDIITPYSGEIVGYIELCNSYQVIFEDKNTIQDLYQLSDDLLTKSDHILSATVHYMNEYGVQWTAPNDYENETEFRESWENYPDASGENWNLEAINVPNAWKYINTDTTIRVGVIDGGFSTSHIGLNIVHTWENTFSPLTEDKIHNINHGNHVAGTIGATWNDGGTAGIVNNAEIYGFSYLSDSNNITNKSGVYKGVYKYLYALSLIVARDVKVINISLGQNRAEDHQMTSSTKKTIEEEAKALGDGILNLLTNYDFLIIQGAGNQSNSNHPKKGGFGTVYNPQGWVDTEWSAGFASVPQKEARDHIIIVGAFTIDESTTPTNYKISTYSNIGDEVDILAPGGDYITPDNALFVWSTGAYAYDTAINT